MLNFPLPYTDELLYSTIARAGIQQGITSPKVLLDNVFGSRSVIASVDLPCHIEKIARHLPRKYDSERLIYSHTLFPLYAPFVPEVRRLQCINWMHDESNGAVHLALGVAASRIKTPLYFRYCPKCLEGQRSRCGEYFWLREWQVTGFDACPEHGRLINSSIGRPLVERHRFIDASPHHCPLLNQEPICPLQATVARQIKELLSLSPKTSPSFSQWTDYYHGLASDFDMMRGNQQINHLTIRKKILESWPSKWLIDNNLFSNRITDNESDWLQSIFRKHRKSFSYLMHIVVHQACYGDDWHIEQVLEKVAQYPLKQKKVWQIMYPVDDYANTPDQKAWLHLLSSNPPKASRTVSPALYARLYRNYHGWLLKVNNQNSAGHSQRRDLRINWDKRDLEVLSILQELWLDFEAKKNGPRRSRAYYLKALDHRSTVENNLFRMPQSTIYLHDHAESTGQYQVRRLQNAHAALHRRYDLPPRWRILRESHLSEERLTDYARKYLDRLFSRQ